ncbi:MAG: hypothetical protein DCC47_18320 [Acidobacteria bacterium]|nr:MAG: hypothetical protein DCC47_18320 [Acidobacteriota bacterium]
MPTQTIRRAGHALLVPALAALTVLAAAPAAAQDPVDPPGDVVFGTQTLGFGDTVAFRGHSDTATLTVPVPDGLRPAAFDTTVQMPANVSRGWIDVQSQGLLLARIDLPAAGTLVPVSLPLEAAPVMDRAVTVTLTVHLLPFDGICPEDWTDRSVVLRDGRVRYTGAPTPPAVVADFLPPILESLELSLPADPTPAESATALDLTAAVTAQYTGRPLRVTVQPLPGDDAVPPAPAGPFTRQIAIVETDGAGAAALVDVPGGVPALAVTGNADALRNQARLVTSDISSVAVASAATVGTLGLPPRLSPDATTLGELGLGALTDTGVGVVEVPLGIDQTRLGRPSHNLRINLQGSYTPLPTTEGGLVSVTVGDTVVDSWPADATGRLDRWITVPDTVLGRVTDVVVSLRSTGGTHQCGLQQPMTLTVDAGSRVTTEPADPPQPGGFRSLPQALLPKVNVAATEAGIADTARAVALVAGLQGLTSVPLDPEWVSLDEAATGSTPAIVVAADGRVPEQLELPLTGTQGRTLDLVDPATGDATTVTFPTDVEFASLQVARDGERAVLVAAATDVPAELDRTLGWLAAQPQRWAELDGDVLFTTADRDPVELALTDPATESTSQQSLAASTTWVLVGGGIVLAAGLAAAVIGALRWRRGRPRPH